MRPVAAPCSRLPLSAVRCGRWRPLAPWRSGAQTEQWWPPFSAWAPSCLRDRFLPQAWRQVPDRPIPRKARRSVSKKGLTKRLQFLYPSLADLVLPADDHPEAHGPLWGVSSAAQNSTLPSTAAPARNFQKTINYYKLDSGERQHF